MRASRVVFADLGEELARRREVGLRLGGPLAAASSSQPLTPSAAARLDEAAALLGELERAQSERRRLRRTRAAIT